VAPPDGSITLQVVARPGAADAPGTSPVPDLPLEAWK